MATERPTNTYPPPPTPQYRFGVRRGCDARTRRPCFGFSERKKKASLHWNVCHTLTRHNVPRPGLMASDTVFPPHCFKKKSQDVQLGWLSAARSWWKAASVCDRQEILCVRGFFFILSDTALHCYCIWDGEIQLRHSFCLKSAQQRLMMGLLFVSHSCCGSAHVDA